MKSLNHADFNTRGSAAQGAAFLCQLIKNLLQVDESHTKRLIFFSIFNGQKTNKIDAENWLRLSLWCFMNLRLCNETKKK